MMPIRAPRICACGHVIGSGQRCPCQIRRDAERNRRADANRPTARERGYDGKWEKERAAFLKTNPTCVRCGAEAKVVDHKIPHKGDMRLFWSRSNWQTLCTTCHVRWKQRLERKPHR
ncbi:HNH endonuclease [Ancylobacter novellus DSM 506]|uniref:Putative HNH nuclease YajD n=1 Tax=Ancylobacter novellus (strain ATCC 8093 / DSM 506 / JCM 20403 / CCM 1077 / IAM 12100 / NBRC 12443 / NCIMB 10456) TaxID=639283 RepID=D7A0A0_ANCN5|nr:HNH endonuclease [Ancylobacter novellus DSM 506]